MGGLILHPRCGSRPHVLPATPSHPPSAEASGGPGGGVLAPTQTRILSPPHQSPILLWGRVTHCTPKPPWDPAAGYGGALPPVGFTCHGYSGWAGGVRGSVRWPGGGGDPKRSPLPAQHQLWTVPPQPAGGFMPQLGGGDAGAGATVVLRGWSTAPFPSLPSRLDAMMMDGRQAVALGPPLVPRWILGYPGLGGTALVGCPCPLCVTHLRVGEEMGAAPTLSPRQSPSRHAAAARAPAAQPSTPGIKKRGEVLRHPRCAGRLGKASVALAGGGKCCPLPCSHPKSWSHLYPGTRDPQS